MHQLIYFFKKRHHVVVETLGDSPQSGANHTMVLVRGRHPHLSTFGWLLALAYVRVSIADSLYLCIIIIYIYIWAILIVTLALCPPLHLPRHGHRPKEVHAWELRLARIASHRKEHIETRRWLVLFRDVFMDFFFLRGHYVSVLFLLKIQHQTLGKLLFYFEIECWPILKSSCEVSRYMKSALQHGVLVFFPRIMGAQS